MGATDPLKQRVEDATVSVRDAALVAPSDDEQLEHVTTGISFAAEGALDVTFANNRRVTIPSGMLAAGIIHPLQIKKIWAAGTAMSDLMVYWTEER